jgi:hypothetical protein
MSILDWTWGGLAEKAQHGRPVVGGDDCVRHSWRRFSRSRFGFDPARAHGRPWARRRRPARSGENCRVGVPPTRGLVGDRSADSGTSPLTTRPQQALPRSAVVGIAWAAAVVMPRAPTDRRRARAAARGGNASFPAMYRHRRTSCCLFDLGGAWILGYRPVGRDCSRRRFQSDLHRRLAERLRRERQGCVTPSSTRRETGRSRSGGALPVSRNCTNRRGNRRFRLPASAYSVGGPVSTASNLFDAGRFPVERRTAEVEAVFCIAGPAGPRYRCREPGPGLSDVPHGPGTSLSRRESNRTARRQVRVVVGADRGVVPWVGRRPVAAGDAVVDRGAPEPSSRR